MQARPVPRPTADDALFLFLLALLATTLGYRFGFGNQAEQLPLVLRALDPALYANDFYVRSAEGFGPRFYYVALLAGLARWLPLPLVVLALAFLVNLAISVITHLAARDLLRADRLGGRLAATLALLVGSFPTGLVTDIRFHDFQPGSLAIPFCLLAVWAGLRGRPVAAAALAGIGSLPHPLYGVETGALALLGASAALLLRAPAGASGVERLRALRPVVAGGVVLVAATLLFWGLPWLGANPERLPDVEFIAVLAFRSPHHYLPSAFPAGHWLLLLAFLAASVLAWWRWRAATAPSPGDLAFAAPAAGVLALCAGGVVLVELWPTRAMLTAQPFRLLYLVKWQGFLLLGWLLARWWREAALPRTPLAVIAWLATGASQPLVVLGCLGADRVDAALRPRTGMPRWLAPALAAVAAVPLGLALAKPRELAALAVAGGVALLLDGAPGAARRVLATMLVALPVGLAVANRGGDLVAWDELRPVVRFEDHRGPEADLARFARLRLPEDAVVHVPPGLASFRLLARRAVVVDFKALPFPEQALREWRTRMRDAYGEVPGGGFEALLAMDASHRATDDAALAAVARRYGADHAVLYRETPTALPVLYENAVYKLVAL